MKRITIHWTAGSYTSRETSHYHFTVDPNGGINLGKDPEVNKAPLKAGYVAHCGGGNTNNIGVSMMGMAGFKNAKNVGKYPLTAKQCEATWKLVASLCKEFNIPVTPDTVFTHYEFGKNNPRTSSAGKIDIIHLPHVPHLKKEEIGDYIRGKVKWYLSKLT